MAQIESWFKQDLNKPVQVQMIRGNVFSQDVQANKIGVEIFRDGEAESISGTITANVIRQDGGTVAVTGDYSENKAWVVLPAAAYAYPGQIVIALKVTLDGITTTLLAVTGTVYRTSTDTVVDPGTIIPSIQTLISQIQTAVASIPADYSSLWTSLAPAFSTSTAYVAGQYVTNSGKVWRFITNHSAGAWDSSHVIQVNIGNELTALKSALKQSIPITQDYIFDKTTGKNVYSTSNNYKLLPSGLCASDSDYKLLKYPVTAGQIIYVDSELNWQFQSDWGVPSSGTNANRIGGTYTQKGFFEVPTGAIAVICTANSNDSSVLVYNAKSTIRSRFDRICWYFSSSQRALEFDRTAKTVKVHSGHVISEDGNRIAVSETTLSYMLDASDVVGSKAVVYDTSSATVKVVYIPSNATTGEKYYNKNTQLIIAAFSMDGMNDGHSIITMASYRIDNYYREAMYDYQYNMLAPLMYPVEEGACLNFNPFTKMLHVAKSYLYLYNGRRIVTTAQDLSYLPTNPASASTILLIYNISTQQFAVIYDSAVGNYYNDKTMRIIAAFNHERIASGKISAICSYSVEDTTGNTMQTPVRLKLMSYNIGVFTEGVPTDITEQQQTEIIAKCRAFFTKYFCDMVGMQEYKSILYDETPDEAIFDPLYKYYFGQDESYGWENTKTNFTLSDKTVGTMTGDRNYYRAKTCIGGKLVDIFNVHFALDAADRATNFSELISMLNNCKYFIVFGDFNAQTASEYEVLSEEGYNLANCGYFGVKSTTATNKPLDNIVTSANIKIVSVDVPDVMDEMVSDHLPVIAEIIL